MAESIALYLLTNLIVITYTSVLTYPQTLTFLLVPSTANSNEARVLIEDPQVLSMTGPYTRHRLI
jgi:hypothetical protein